MTVQFTCGSAPFYQTYSPGDHDATSLFGRCTDPQPLHAPDSSLLLSVGLSLDPFFVHSPICMKFLWRCLCVGTLCLEVCLCGDTVFGGVSVWGHCVWRCLCVGTLCLEVCLCGDTVFGGVCVWGHCVCLEVSVWGHCVWRCLCGDTVFGGVCVGTLCLEVSLCGDTVFGGVCVGTLCLEVSLCEDTVFGGGQPARGSFQSPPNGRGQGPVQTSPDGRILAVPSKLSAPPISPVTSSPAAETHRPFSQGPPGR
ncbi:uncharacterized protein LOC126943872 isoform X31 [Macaca thibetana thibetana]|uniref:uncharacterized protein LOC126943872 isoform X30 n=1 Tax=Macaca thibetana thibetana TaxID=257877 RepID=UPI0021BCFB41|nr:uncharacterized protein LOC126943872 isoform X30 [Macaca thibetana thibetana]XP_050629035.1 uncharacterized protein LOC126943872 isoform X31 [Macaca thibetana thibetana]